MPDVSLPPPTEAALAASGNLDCLPTEAVLRLINHADLAVPQAVRAAIPAITPVVDAVVSALSAGRRVLYVGAGTSGRLAVLDAAECPPTFSTPPACVQALIAGGDAALKHAIEGAEDDAAQGVADLRASGVQAGDVVIGLSASGGAPYVVAALQEARHRECVTAGITSVPHSALAQAVALPVVVETGPEVLAGSTRMKAGTAQKLVLNMISTAAMAQWGKTYGNRMIDVRPTNRKLRARAQALVVELAAVSASQALALLELCDWEVKTAVLVARQRLEPGAARDALARAHGKLRVALEASSEGTASPIV